jgi:phosphatidylglycerophosphatase A
LASKTNKTIPPAWLLDPRHVLSLGFGSGLAPLAPGTFGTLAAIPVYWMMSTLPLEMYLIITLLAFVVGIYLCGFTSRRLGVHDHSGIVWDEVVGYLITMIAVPATWTWMLAGFILFRFFDILKPWPIRWADKRLHGGFGIMFDDVLAGIFSLLALHSIQYVL